MPEHAEPTLTEEQFDRLARYGNAEQVEAGDVLYSTGDRAYDLFLVVSASVDVVMDATATEPETPIYRRGPGEFTGELSLLTGQRVYLTAHVTTAGRVVRVTIAELRRALAEQVDIADVLVEALTVRRKIMQERARSALEIVGVADSATGRALQAFAMRLELPHSAVDSESAEGRRLMAANGLRREDLPAAVIADRVLRRATPRDVADVIGLACPRGEHDVDLVVVGAGPSGLAAAVYGASEGLSTIVLDAAGLGGQAASSSRIENYLGFPRGVSGEELTRLAMVQALKFGAHVYATCSVHGLEQRGRDAVVVKLADGTEVGARAAIVATGAKYRRLDVPRWGEFEARGQVRYSATRLDARGCEDCPVTVIGGANSAGQAAIFLAPRGSRVDIVIRAEDIDSGMSAYLARRILADPAIRVRTSSRVTALNGDPNLTSVVVTASDGEETELESRYVFCFIGAEPATDWLGEVTRDDDGFVLTGSRLAEAGGRPGLPFQTNLRRVFAAGDARCGSTKRVASAVGEGAGAVASIHRMLAEDDRLRGEGGDRDQTITNADGHPSRS